MLGNEAVWDDGYFLKYPGFQLSNVDLRSLLLGSLPMAEGKVYRPFRSLIYVASFAITNQSMVLLHLQGLLLHLGIVVAIYWLVKRITNNNWTAFATSLIFGVHPVHTEAISFMTANFDTFGIAFGLFAIITHFLYRDTNLPKWKIITQILLLLAFFTYELTYTVFFVLILADWLIFNKIEVTVKSIRSYISQNMSYMIIFGISILIRYFALPHAPSKLHYLFFSQLKTILFVPVIIIQYFKIQIWPFFQSANHNIYPGISNFSAVDPGMIYPEPIFRFFSAPYLIPTICFILLSLIIWKWGKRNTNVWFFGLFSLATLTPVLQIIPLYSIFAERYIYLSSVGVSALIAIALTRLPDKARWTLLIIITCTLSALTFRRNIIWHDTLSFWKDTVDHSAPSAYAYRNLGGSYYLNGDYVRTAETLEFAAKIQPRNLDTYKKLFSLYWTITGEKDKAKRIIEQAAADFPEKADIIRSQLDQIE